MKRSVSSRQIVGVDLLRFAAALLVTFYHLTYLTWADPYERAGAQARAFRIFADWAPYVDTGWVGVQIFFVISGFVIAYTANGRSPMSFLVSRIVRLLPGVWICASLSVVALLAGGIEPVDCAGLYLRSIILWPFGPWVASSYWTLPIEIVFYLVIFVLLCRDRFARIESVAIWLAGLCLAVWLFAVTDSLWPTPAGDRLVALLTHRYLKLLLLQHGCYFALGMMMWIVRERGPTVGRFVILFLCVIAAVLQIADETARAGAWAGISIRPAPAILLFLASLGLVAASIRWNAAAHAVLGNSAGRVRAIGLITYPVYLLHQPLAVPLTAWQLRAGIMPVLALGQSVLVIIALSWLVAMRLEPAVRALLKPALDALEQHIGRRFPGAVQKKQPLSATVEPRPRRGDSYSAHRTLRGDAQSAPTSRRGDLRR